MNTEPNPAHFLDQIEVALPSSVPSESKRLLEQARAWATVFYDGRVPETIAERLTTLEEFYGITR